MIKYKHLKVSQRLYLGFGLILAFVLIAFMTTFVILNRSVRITTQNLTIVTPSLDKISVLHSQINDSKMLTKNWVFMEKHAETPDKNACRKSIRRNILPLKKLW